jgi:hypothetical protein
MDVVYLRQACSVLDARRRCTVCTHTYMLTGNININATTRDIHCEMDVTYTTIHVPNQIENNAHIVFEFKINDCTSIILNIKQNATITYSAYCLAHRQVTTYGNNCMNISTYSNKRLFSSYKQSYKRIKKS